MDDGNTLARNLYTLLKLSKEKAGIITQHVMGFQPDYPTTDDSMRKLEP